MVIVLEMRNPGEDGELSAMFIEVAQVPRVFVTESGCFRKKERCVHPEVAGDEKQAFW
jgi:hypothetical protein